MNLSAPFILRPVMTIFVMLSIAVCGWLSFIYLPVSDVPTIEYPQIEVKASYSGANPETMLYLVTIPIEKELTLVKGVEEMLSNSSVGTSSITMKFPLSKDMNEAIRDVQDALNRAEKSLPKDMTTRPSYSREVEGQEPIMYMLLTSDKIDVGDLRNYAEAYVIPRLSRIEGIAQVTAMGASNSFWIRINPEYIAARNISFDEVVESVKKFTETSPLGAIQTSSKNISLEIQTKSKSIKEIENIYIGNSFVRIKDIAEVSTKSHYKQEFFYVTAKERTKPLILSIQKVNDANTVAISEEVKKSVALLQKELPQSLNLSIWFDKAVWIQESIVDVQYSLFFAFILVVLVIYFSLGRFSDALIPIIALPLSLFGTFIVMYFLGFSLDLLSLLALTLSVGFVVDDAIVVLENIVRYQEQGESALRSSLEGSKQICFTILSMTVSLVAVFIPLLFMQGINGRLFREFSVTLAIAIIVSGFISLSVTPMLCRFFLKDRKLGDQTRLEKFTFAVNENLVRCYVKCLKLCFCYSKSVLSIALVSFIAILPLFKMLPINLLPSEDRGFVLISVSIPTGTLPSQVLEYQTTIEDIIKNNPDVDNFLDFNLPSNLVFFVRLHSLEQRKPQALVIGEMQAALNQIPGIQSFVRGYQLINLEFDFGSGGQYRYYVRGTDSKEVNMSAKNLVKALRSESLIASVQEPQSSSVPKLTMTINDEYAHKLGIDRHHVQKLLYHAYGKESPGKIQNGLGQDIVYMELQEGYRDHIDSLNKISINTPKGLIPLKAIAKWKEEVGPMKLYRKDQLPATFFRFSLDSSMPAQQGIEKVEEIAATILPENINGIMSNSAKAISTAMSQMLYLLLAAAIVMYIVLGILYESFVHPLTILSSLPFACLGGIITLFIFNEPISIFSSVGFLLLIGIVKKNGIMMVDYALEAKKKGFNSKDAILQGGIARFRPIMMTTIAAVMGALPIAIGFGDGAETRRGLGLVIVGGLLFSQILTILITPLLFLFFENLAAYFPDRFRFFKPESGPSPKD